MKVKFIRSVVGPGGQDCAEGDVLDLSNTDATRVIKDGDAVAVTEEGEPKKTGKAK